MLYFIPRARTLVFIILLWARSQLGPYLRSACMPSTWSRPRQISSTCSSGGVRLVTIFYVPNLKMRHNSAMCLLINMAQSSRCHHSYCCTTCTAELLRPFISWRWGLTTPPTSCLRDTAHTLLWTDPFCLLVELGCVR